MSTPISNSESVLWHLNLVDETPGATNQLVLRIQDVVVSQIDCLVSSHSSSLADGITTVTVLDEKGEQKTYDVVVKGLTKKELSDKMALEEAVAKNLACHPSSENLQFLFAEQTQKMKGLADKLSADRITRLLPEDGSSEIFEIFAKRNSKGFLSVQSHKDYHLAEIIKDPKHQIPIDLWQDRQFFIQALEGNLQIFQQLNSDQLIYILHTAPHLLQDPRIVDSIASQFPKDQRIMLLLLQGSHDLAFTKKILYDHPKILKHVVEMEKIQSLFPEDRALKTLIAVSRSEKKCIDMLLDLSKEDRDYVILTLIQEDPSLLETIYRVKPKIDFGKEFVLSALERNRATGDYLLDEIDIIVDDPSSTPQDLTPLLRYLMFRVRQNPEEIGLLPDSVRQRHAFAKKALEVAPKTLFYLKPEDWLAMIEKKPKVIGWVSNGKTIASHLGIDFVIQAIEKNNSVVESLLESQLNEIVGSQTASVEIGQLCQKELELRKSHDQMAQAVTVVTACELSEAEKASMDQTLYRAFLDHTVPSSPDKNCYIFPNTEQVGGKSISSPSSFFIEVEQRMGWRPGKAEMEDVALRKELQGGILLGVFDGHGGKKVSNYISQRFETFFAYELNKHEGHVPSTFSDLFAKIEKEIQQNEDLNSHGSTAVLSFLDTRTNTLYTATLGDSAAYLYLEGKKKVAPLSIWGRWNVDEAKRAEENGATIEFTRRYSRDGQPVNRAKFHGAYIEPSRSFGDGIFGSILSKEPILTVTKISKGDILILASDGVLELPERAILRVIERAKNDGASISHELCEEAVKISADDLTATVLYAI